MANKWLPNKEDKRRILEMKSRTNTILDIQDRLSPSQQLMVQCILREGKSFEETAQILEIGVASCYKKWERLYQNILKIIRKLPPPKPLTDQNLA